MTREIVRRPWERIDRILGAGVRIPRGGLSADKLAELDWFYAGIKPLPTDPPGYGVGPYPGRAAVEQLVRRSALPRFRDGGPVNPDDALINPSWPMPSSLPQPQQQSQPQAAGGTGSYWMPQSLVQGLSFGFGDEAYAYYRSQLAYHAALASSGSKDLAAQAEKEEYDRVFAQVRAELAAEHKALRDSSAWHPIAKGVANDAEAVSNANKITEPQARNAIAHAHTAAKIRVISGSSRITTNLGNLKEQLQPSADFDDTEKDLYNNAIGRQIGEYIAEHNIKNAIDDLIMDAYRNGRLVLKNDDPKRKESPVWSGPSPFWRGQSAGRVYTDTRPLPLWSGYK